jgi:NADH dehydrogenase
MEERVKKIVIVGGGFAGINFAKNIWNDPHYEVTMVDKNNYNYFPPLLYQVATAFIEPSNISYPFRRMFEGKKNMRFHLGRFIKVNPDKNNIETDTGVLDYDYLVLAVGTETNYFGMENVKQHSMPMKSIDAAINLRNHLLMNLEEAVLADTATEKQKYLNIVIAGGGPSGVEIAGMLAEMKNKIAIKEYPELSGVHATIHLVDASPHLLGPMSKTAQKAAFNELRKLGVLIKLNTAVKDYMDDIVYMADGKTVATKTLIWTSGVTGRKINGLPAEVVGRGRRILVDEFNKVKNIENIYALGDMCLQTTDKNYPDGHPQLAQVAIQQGTLLAKNFKRLADGKTMKPFSYVNKGSMAIISKYEAVADLPKVSFAGFFAWLIWLFVHIIPLVGFRNKVKIAFSWFWSFITNNPTLRLIIRPRHES